MEYPVEGKHTDTEEESDGVSTPIFIQTILPPAIEAQPKGASASSLSSSLAIPKRNKKSKRSKKSKKSSHKSQPKKSRVSGKKNRKDKKKKSKKPVSPPSSSPRQ